MEVKTDGWVFYTRVGTAELNGAGPDWMNWESFTKKKKKIGIKCQFSPKLYGIFHQILILKNL